MKVRFKDLSKGHSDKSHEPLEFLLGQFTGSQIGWATLEKEKEAFAVMVTTDRMYWLLPTPDGFDLYTDSHNLLFLFDSLAVVPDISISSTCKVLRWDVRFRMYNYTCLHIKGLDNVWADIIVRCSQLSTMRRILQVLELQYSDADDFVWPNTTDISKEQAEHNDECPKNLTIEKELWVDSSG